MTHVVAPALGRICPEPLVHEIPAFAGMTEI